MTDHPATSTPPATAAPLYRSAIRAAQLGLAVNLALGVIKLVGGLVGSSFALISDAVNSLGDSFTSVVTWMALRYSQRPPDSEHPYGHTRAETVAGAYVALIVVMTALLIGWEAAQRLFVVHEIPPVWTLWLAGANAAIKELLYRYKSRIGRRIGSSSLVATAWDHRSDALCSLAVLVGLAAVRWGGQKWLWADEVAALVVVLFILWTGVRLFRSSTSELLDPQAEPEMVEVLRDLACSVPGVTRVEKLWARKMGLEYHVDVHVQVPPEMTVREGHAIGHAVKDLLIHRVAAVRDVLVHLEPNEVEPENPREVVPSGLPKHP